MTIHSGELKQIRRLIESPKKKNPANGQLYGLWTHSNQPVIQYVIGDPKGGGDVAKFLYENHGLRHVGNWSTKEFEDKMGINGTSPLSFVKMTVELLDGGKIMNVKLSVIEKESKLNGALETLEGQSAFRLKSPFLDQGDQKRYHAPPEDDALVVRDLSPKPSQEATTNKTQWYSTEEGMQLFGKIHGALQEHFEVRPSRDTTTHDLCLSLKSEGSEFAVDFPHNFPQESAILIKADNRREKIILQASSEGGTSESFKDQKALHHTEDEAAEDTDAVANLNPAKISQSPPSSVKDEKKERGAKANRSLDPEEIPQLLVEKIRSLVFGTSV